MSHFTNAIEVILDHEGGFVDNAHDPGGATKLGISLRFLKKQDPELADIDDDGDIDADDVKAMSMGQAVEFYRINWWERYGYHRLLSPSIATKIFDLAVTMGGRQAHKLAQRALWSVGTEVQDDGILGPISISQLNLVESPEYLPALRSEAAGFYRGLVMRNAALRDNGVKKSNGDDYENLSVFLSGWLSRAYT